MNIENIKADFTTHHIEGIARLCNKAFATWLLAQSGERGVTQ